MAGKKDEKNQGLDSEKQLQKQEKPQTSVGLSKNLSMKLISLIEDVNKCGVTPETVNASCNAAAQIHKLLKLNYDMKKDGF